MKSREEQIQEIVASFPKFKGQEITLHFGGKFSVSENKEEKKRRRFSGTYSIQDTLTSNGIKKALLIHK